MAKRLSILVFFVLMTVISCTTSNPTAPGGGGQGLTFDKGIFVLNGLSGTISFLNLENDSLNYEFIGTGQAPNDMVYLNNVLYIINSTSHTLTAYSRTDSGLFLYSSLDLGAAQNVNPYDIITDSKILYITCLNSNEIIVIDPISDWILARVDVGLSPEGLSYDNEYIYIACTGMDSSYNYGDGYIYKLRKSDNQVVDSCKVGTNPQYLINVNNELHISCTGDYSNITGKIYIVSTQDSFYVRDSLDIGGTPGRLCFDGNETIYSAAGGWGADGQVYSYNINGNIVNGSSNPIRTPSGAMDLEFYDNKLYVACFSADSLAELQNGSVVKTWAIGDGPVNLMVW